MKMDDKKKYFWTGAIWVLIGFGGVTVISTVMGFFEDDVNFFLALVMLAWVLFWISSRRVIRLSRRIAGAIVKRVEEGKNNETT